MSTAGMKTLTAELCDVWLYLFSTLQPVVAGGFTRWHRCSLCSVLREAIWCMVSSLVVLLQPRKEWSESCYYLPHDWSNVLKFLFPSRRGYKFFQLILRMSASGHYIVFCRNTHTHLAGNNASLTLLCYQSSSNRKHFSIRGNLLEITIS